MKLTDLDMEAKEAQEAIDSLPPFSRRVLEWLVTTGWYNLDCEPGFSDVTSGQIARALGCSAKAVNGAIGHLMAARIIYTNDDTGRIFIHARCTEEEPGRGAWGVLLRFARR